MSQKTDGWNRHARALCVTVAILVLAAGLGPAQDRSAKKTDRVQVSAVADKPGPDGKQLVTITITIEKEWHIYANPVKSRDTKLPEDFSGVPTAVTVSINGKPAAAKVSYPEGKLVQKTDGAYRVYEEQVALKATVERLKSASGPLEVSVEFQACNEVKMQCLAPKTVKLTVS